MPRSPGALVNVSRVKRADGTVCEYFYNRKTKEFLGYDRTAAEAGWTQAPKPKLGGRVKLSRAKRADGTVHEYFYNRITNERLPVTTRAAAEAYMAEWREAGAQAPTAKPLVYTFNDLAAIYYRSELFEGQAPKTRRLYRFYLEKLREDFGDEPLASFTRARAKEMRRILASTPGKCTAILSILRILFKLALEDELVAKNVFAGIGSIRRKPREQFWTPEQIEAFIAAAERPSLRLAIKLMLYTAQRPNDVLAMTKGQVREVGDRLFIALRQQKTGELLDLPVHAGLDADLRARLADRNSTSLMLVPSPAIAGRWNYANFAKEWDETRKRAGLSSLQRRDLRRTAVIYMAMAGLPVPQIAAITGHRIERTAAIINTYLPQRTEVALAGMTAWESAPPLRLDNIVSLAAKRAKR